MCIVGNMKKRSLDKKLVKTDERGRVSLVGFDPSEYYEISRGEDGELILFPVAVVPAYIAAQNRELAGSAERPR